MKNCVLTRSVGKTKAKAQWLESVLMESLGAPRMVLAPWLWVPLPDRAAVLLLLLWAGPVQTSAEL